MVFFLPIGLADAPAARIPWVSLALALSWVAVFAGTPVFRPDPEDQSAAWQEVENYWHDHPYLVPTDTMEGSDTDSDEARREYARREAAGTLPEPAVLAQERAHFEALVDGFLNTFGHSSRRWGIVPARGLKQPGWLTHMFIHADVWHLGGNLLFFLIVAPTLETLLGGWVFLLFFLVSGVLSGAFQAWLSAGSPIGIIGASGAIAACMGLFTIHYASRRVKLLVVFLYLLLIPRLLFRLTATGRRLFRIIPAPAWLCGGLWMLGQLWDLATGSNQGVAVGAHAAGFGLGVGTAILLATTGLHRKLTAPIKDGEKLWAKDADLEAAQDALSRNHLIDAERGFRAVLDRRPTSSAACWGLAQIKFTQHDLTAGTKLFDRAVTQWLAEGNELAVQDAIVACGMQLDLTLLRPSLLARVAHELETVNRDVAIKAYELSAASGGEKSKRRLEELRGPGHPALARFPDHPPAPPAIPMPAPPEPARAEIPLPPLAPARVSALVCALEQFTETGVQLRTLSGKPLEIPFQDIQRISVGMVAEFQRLEGPLQNVLLTDLQLSPVNGARRVARLPSHLIPLAAFYPPDVPPVQAYYSLVAYVAQISGAEVWPQLEYLAAGQYPQFPSAEQFEGAAA